LLKEIHMHDIDRTQGEFAGESQGEYGQELGTELFEFGQETGESSGAFEFGAEIQESESPFNEVQEMELASELLEIQSEAELDQFLGKLIKSATKAVGGFVRSPVGRALGGALKSVAKKALPLAGAALGNLVLPGVGGAIGGQLASAASNLFELELEGLSQEDREFEVAKQYVRLAGAAARNAVQQPQTAQPSRAASQALSSAARTFAPGLLRPGMGALPGPRLRSGRWVRRGRTIVLFGA
jgi:hypothetical protein